MVVVVAGGRGGHGGRDGRHHGRGGHIKWCLGFGAFLFLAMVTTFSVIFKKFVRAFRSYHSLVELRASSSAMSLEERNRICRDATEANCRSRKALRKQQSRQNAAQPQYSYVPPCEPPSVESALLRQEIVEEAPRVSAPQPQQPQATYTLEQVKELLEMDRQALRK